MAFDPTQLNRIRYRNEDEYGSSIMGNDCSGTTATCQVDSFKSGVPLSGSVAKLSVGIGTVLPGSLTNNNVAVGANALKSMTDWAGAQYNVAVGVDALTSLTDAYRCTAVGHNALRLVTTGIDNTAVGYGTMPVLVDGLENTAVGSRALAQITNASENTAVGLEALWRCNGDQNTAIGFQAGQAITTGIRNIMIGDRTDTAATSNNCISIGYSAVSGSWVLNTMSPIAVVVNSTALSGTTPAIPANATNLLRIRLNGTNYTIPLMADQ